jgi:hypothetical protein
MAASAISELVKALPENPPDLLVISALYEDASGKETWKVRGREKLEKWGCRTWLLTVEEGGHQRRQLDTGQEKLSLILDDGGFEKRSHSSSSTKP